jgi:hypothetical protein
MAAQSRKLVPGLAAVFGPEHSSVLHSGEDGVGIVQRGFQMPDPLELPGARRAVIPLMRAGNSFIRKLVADRLPRLAAVVGTLDHLPEPAAALRRVEPVRFYGRPFEVVELPAREVGAIDVPLLSRCV